MQRKPSDMASPTLLLKVKHEVKKAGTNSSFHTWHTFPEKSGKSWSWSQSYIEDTKQKRECFHRLQPLSFLERKTIDKESEEVTLLVSVRKLLRAAYF